MTEDGRDAVEYALRRPQAMRLTAMATTADSQGITKHMEENNIK